MPPKDKVSDSEENNDDQPNELVIPHDTPFEPRLSDQLLEPPPVVELKEGVVSEELVPQPLVLSAESLSTEPVISDIDKISKQLEQGPKSDFGRQALRDANKTDDSNPQPLPEPVEHSVVYSDINYDKYLDAHSRQPETKRTKKLFLFILIPTAAIIVIGCMVILVKILGGTPSNYIRQSVSNGNFHYSFLFYKESTPINSGSVNSLSGENLIKTVNLVVIPKPSIVQEDCAVKYPKLIVAFRQSIQSKGYSVCTDEYRVAFFTYFKYNDVWQAFTIYTTDQGRQIDNSTLMAILGSIKITKIN